LPRAGATAQLLESHGWPGNVRELENEMLRVLMLTSSGSLVSPKGLSRKILESIAHGGGRDETLLVSPEKVAPVHELASVTPNPPSQPSRQ
jgi:transcriptional regulator with PAS, ATPase and Fis domain